MILIIQKMSAKNRATPPAGHSEDNQTVIFVINTTAAAATYHSI